MNRKPQSLERSKRVLAKDGAREDAPRDYQALVSLIASFRPTLPKRLTQVADFAIGNPDEVAFGTAASVAQKADVQPSTLVRFAQHFGYAGFSDLQSVFRERLRQRMPNYEDRLASLKAKRGKDRDASMVLTGVCEAAEHSLTGLIGSFDTDALNASIALLAKADTIYLMGQRRSYPIASYMAYGLGKLGIKSRLIGSEAGIDPEIAAFATKRDAALAFSFTPYASATIDVAGQLASQNVPMVAITDSPFSPLVQSARQILEIVEADFEGFRSLSATMALGLALTIGIAEARE